MVLSFLTTNDHISFEQKASQKDIKIEDPCEKSNTNT